MEDVIETFGFPSFYFTHQQRLVDLWLACRAVGDVRIYPTIWRTRLLLTSRVWAPDKDTRIWENTNGQLTAFAASAEG
jgi:hypothetical protein